MKPNSNNKIVRAFSGWLLLLCCLTGCNCCNEKPTHVQMFPCDPCFGFRPTCWHPWPGNCCQCPIPGWTEPPTNLPPDGEIVPTPVPDSNVPRQPPAVRQPQELQKNFEPPPPNDSQP